jgi:hypothetical protein
MNHVEVATSCCPAEPDTQRQDPPHERRVAERWRCHNLSGRDRARDIRQFSPPGWRSRTGGAFLISGTVVTLTARVTGNRVFAGWSGACTGTGTCTVTMNADKAVTATFNRQ